MVDGRGFGERLQRYSIFFSQFLFWSKRCTNSSINGPHTLPGWDLQESSEFCDRKDFSLSVTTIDGIIYDVIVCSKAFLI